KDCYDQAIVDFNQTLRFSPRNEEYYYNRALAFSMKGFLDQALADFNTVLELNPRFIMAFYSRAEIYEKMSYWKEAVGDYKVFLRFASRQHGPYIEQAQERILALKEK
ncbi:MAG TPA: tetratricopeptide repeat protein, partial [Atribacter sp.]|uniref:tetratricopeptide repeat protein n=1 Tax=Atribacter sp. TaxID=2847780 RepID=UPI002C00249A